MRLGAGVIASTLCALCATAFADGSAAPVAPTASAPAAADPRAALAGDDANLESNWPRQGLTLSLSLGAGMVLGDGVGRGPAASFRVGHVATHDTVITFELTGGTRLHQDAVMGAPLYHDDDFSLLAGALTYVLPSLWLRGAGGFSMITTENTSGTARGIGGSGLFGIGLDIVKLHSFALGLESWGMLSLVTHKDFVFDSGLCLGLTYY